MWLASTKLNQPQNCYQLLRPMHYPRNFGFSYIKEGKTKKKRENNPDFFSTFFYCCSSTIVSIFHPPLHWPSHPHFPPLILPPLALSMCPLCMWKTTLIKTEWELCSTTNWPQTQKCVFCKTTRGFVLVFVLFCIYIFNKRSCRNCGGFLLLQKLWLPRASAQNTRGHLVSPMLSGSRTFGKGCTGQTGAEYNYQVKYTFYPLWSSIQMPTDTSKNL